MYKKILFTALLLTSNISIANTSNTNITANAEKAKKAAITFAKLSVKYLMFGENTISKLEIQDFETYDDHYSFFAYHSELIPEELGMSLEMKQFITNNETAAQMYKENGGGEKIEDLIFSTCFIDIRIDKEKLCLLDDLLNSSIECLADSGDMFFTELTTVILPEEQDNLPIPLCSSL